MEYKEKFKIARSLYNPEMLDKDLDLLATIDPSSSLIHKPVTDNNRSARAEEVLWTLLDLASPESIISHRNNAPSPQPEKKQTTQKKQPIEKKKSQRKRSILISRGQAFILSLYKRRTSFTTIVFTPIARWLNSIKSWINVRLKKI